MRILWNLVMYSNNKYIINIMAHNEEDTIKEAINTVLNQEVEKESVIEIHVFANACSDNTEEIVRKIAETNSNIYLHSIKEKGKVNALRECIHYFKNERCLGLIESYDRLFFIDADAVIPEKNVLLMLGKKLNSSQNLYLVSALPVPESCYNQSTDFVSELFRIRYHLQNSFKKNLVRGACNVVRWSALQRIVFPEDLLSTDMFIECKLSGHFLMDHSLQVVIKLKQTLKLEIERDLMHLIAREQVYHWRRKGLIPRLDPETAFQEGFLSPLDPKEYFRYLFKKKGFRSIMIMSIWLFIYKYNEFRSRRIFLNSLKNKMNLLDYWSTKR